MSDDLVERVARAIYEADESNLTPHSVLARAAIAIALEEAARVAEAKADEWATEWRKGLKCDSYLEGMSDGADEAAAAIRAMIPSGNDPASNDTGNAE
jgi:hypothetical protein